MHQADAGNDFVRFALEFAEHLFGFVDVRRFAVEAIVQRHQRVRAENQMIRKLFGDRARFAIGVDLTDFAHRQLFVVDLGCIARNHRESTGRCDNNSDRRGEADARTTGGKLSPMRAISER